MYQEMVKRVPSEQMNVIAPLERIEIIDDASVLVSTLIRDADGGISPSLADYGKIAENNDFWDTLNVAYFCLEEHGFPYFGLNGHNVVVQTTAEGIKPVIVDLKRMSLQTLPFQPWLLSREQRPQKLLRRWDRFCHEYERKV